MKRKWLLRVCVLTLFLSTGCTSAVIGMTKPVMVTLLINPAFDVFLEEEDLNVAYQAIGGQLKLVEILTKNIKKEELKLLLCQGFTSLGLLQEPTLNKMKLAAQQASSLKQKKQMDAEIAVLQKRIRKLALRGRSHCFDILEQKYPGFTKAATLGQADYGKRLTKIEKKDVKILFWAGFGWGYAILNGMTETTLIAQIPQLKQMMQRVVALDPGHFYGSGHLFLATLYAQSPTLGGDVKLAKKHFDLAYKYADRKSLLINYYQARFYTQQVGDSGEKMCKELLQQINKSSTDLNPKIRMVNVLAKELGAIALRDTSEFCP